VWYRTHVISCVRCIGLLLSTSTPLNNTCHQITGLLILQHCIGIGNTIMNIGSSYLLIPIVNTFMKQNCRIHTILVLLEYYIGLLGNQLKPHDSVMFVVLTSLPTQYRLYGRLFYSWSKESTNSIKVGLLKDKKAVL